MLFGNTETVDKLYIGILSGDHASITAQWFIRAADIPARVTFTDVPTMVFSGGPPQNFQICDWIKTRVVIERVTSSGWTWSSSSKTLMPPVPPPVPPVTTRHFEMYITHGRYFRCTGFSAQDGPILVPYAGNAIEDATDDQEITKIDLHALQIMTPMGFNVTMGNKRKAPRNA